MTKSGSITNVSAGLAGKADSLQEVASIKGGTSATGSKITFSSGDILNVGASVASSGTSTQKVADIESGSSNRDKIKVTTVYYWLTR